MILALIVIVIISIVSVMVYSYYNKDTNLLNINNIQGIIPDTFEGFIGSHNPSFIVNTYQNIKNARDKYLDTLTTIQTQLASSNIINMDSHTENINKIKDYQESQKDINNKVFQVIQNRQDVKMNELQQIITELQEKQVPNNSGDVNMINSHFDGTNMRIEPVEETSENEQSNYEDNKYLIFINEQCLSFNGENEYDYAFCDKADPKQHFKIHNIATLDEYNSQLPNLEDRLKSKLSFNFPFNMVKHNSENSGCLNKHSDGISIQPCNLSKNSRWGIVH